MNGMDKEGEIVKVGQKYIQIVADKTDVDGNNRKYKYRKKLVEVIGVYPYIAAFRDTKGLVSCYRHFDIEQMIKKGELRAI